MLCKHSCIYTLSLIVPDVHACIGLMKCSRLHVLVTFMFKPMRCRSHRTVKEYTFVQSTHTCTHPRQQARGMKPRSAQPQSRTPTPTSCAPQAQLGVHTVPRMHRTLPDPSRRLDLCLSSKPSHKLSPPCG